MQAGQIKAISANYRLHSKGRVIHFDMPIIMGIVNVTPDSFFADSRAQYEEAVLDLCAKHLEEGATWLDIGAESTRPGAQQVSASEEQDRLLPAIEAIQKYHPNAVISVDTYRASTAKLAWKHGAHVINDISGGLYDSAMFETIAELNAPYVLMHVQGSPSTMQKKPTYGHVVEEVFAHLTDRVAQLKKVGHDQIIVDPGFGFGKTLAHNYSLMHALPKFTQLGCPILVGISRKSMINRLLNIGPDQALNGTTALHMAALERGANIIRVHDARAAFEAIEIWKAVNKNANTNGDQQF